ATSTQHTPESTPRRSARTTEPTRAGIFDRDSGVAFSTEDPDCFAVLSAWEAAVAPETDFDSDIMPLIRRAEKGCSARAHQDPPVDATAGSRKTTDGGSRPISPSVGAREAALSVMAEVNSCGGRARWCLRALEAADPQGTLLGL
ncbi:unnamed protein product, partial [Ascophyllum nodosum]